MALRNNHIKKDVRVDWVGKEGKGESPEDCFLQWNMHTINTMMCLGQYIPELHTFC